MPTAIRPETYLTNVRQLNFGECRRFGGGLGKGCLFWVLSRFAAPQGETEMPTDYDAIEATLDELSANFHECHAPWREEFAARRFRLVGCQKIRTSKDPKHIDSGGVIYLSPDSRLVGLLTLMIVADETQSSGIRVTESCAVSFYLEGARTVSVVNIGTYLDPRPGSRVVCRKGADLARLHTEAAALADKSRFAVQTFGGWRDVRAALEQEDQENFLHRRDVRRLFVKK